jgi:lipid-binding SYLF domain-containing protein
MLNASIRGMKSYIAHAFAASILVAPLACGHNGETSSSTTPETTQANVPHSKDRAEGKDRLDKSTAVLRTMTSGTEMGKEQRDRAQCVMVVPNMGSGALIVGGQGGKGVVSCRTTTDWSAPAFLKMGGATVGLQAGGQSSDLVILATTADAPGKIFSKNFQFGAGASVAAGPVGKGTEAATAAAAKADFITYAHSRGLYAGVDLSGVSVKQDVELMKAYYGSNDTNAVLSGRVPIPMEARDFVGQLRSAFPKGSKLSSNE